jgi:hypothetical protein
MSCTVKHAIFERDSLSGNPSEANGFVAGNSPSIYLKSLQYRSRQTRCAAPMRAAESATFPRFVRSHRDRPQRVRAHGKRELCVSAIALGRLSFIAAGAVIAFGIGLLAPLPASAQGLFSSLFGGWEQNRRERDFDQPRYYSERGPVSSYAPDTLTGERSPFPGLSRRHSERPASEVRSAGGGGSAHCVRLCDGRYFPLPRSANGTRLDPVKVCSALCPAAETKVFNGGDMNYASASDGTRYADLDNAFTFREKIVPDCSCTGKGPGGLAQIDIESDPTLRVGDVVITSSGPLVYRGSNQFPHKSADFTPVSDYGRMNKGLREKLSDLQVNTGVTPVVPPQKLEAAQGKPTTSSRRSRSSRQVRESHRAERQYGWW